MRLDLGPPTAPPGPRTLERRLLAGQPPALPGLAGDSIRRWQRLPTWMPPETQALCRHRAVDRPHWLVSNHRVPPPGYRLEFDLGVVHRRAHPGTLALVRTRESFLVTPRGGDPGPGAEALASWKRSRCRC